MVSMSEKAEAALKDYFKDKEITPIRIFLQSGGCAGTSLAMVLDEAKDNDDVVKVNGFTLVVDKNLHSMAKGISLDFIDEGGRTGFMLSSEESLGGGGGSCGSCSCC